MGHGRPRGQFIGEQICFWLDHYSMLVKDLEIGFGAAVGAMKGSHEAASPKRIARLAAVLGVTPEAFLEMDTTGAPVAPERPKVAPKPSEPASRHYDTTQIEERGKIRPLANLFPDAPDLVPETIESREEAARAMEKAQRAVLDLFAAVEEQANLIRQVMPGPDALGVLAKLKEGVCRGCLNRRCSGCILYHYLDAYREVRVKGVPVEDAAAAVVGWRNADLESTTAKYDREHPMPTPAR